MGVENVLFGDGGVQRRVGVYPYVGADYMTSHWGASAYDTFDFESREMVTTKLPTAESLPPF